MYAKRLKIRLEVGKWGEKTSRIRLASGSDPVTVYNYLCVVKRVKWAVAHVEEWSEVIGVRGFCWQEAYDSPCVLYRCAKWCVSENGKQNIKSYQ